MSLWVGLLMVAAGLFVMAWAGWRLCEAHYEQDRDEKPARGWLASRPREASVQWRGPVAVSSFDVEPIRPVVGRTTTAADAESVDFDG